MMRRPGNPLIAAAAACALALALFGIAALRAIDAVSAQPGAAQPAPDDGAADAVQVTAAPGLDEQALQLAVDHDPFSEQRTRTAERYRLPGDIEPELPPPAPPPALPDFRVVGTAVSGDGGFAVVRIGDAPPRVLAIGEFLGGYRLQGVGPGYATMANDEREITVMVSGPAAQVAARQPAQPQRGRRGQAQQGGANNDRDRMMVDAVLQRLRSEGAPPQVLQQVARFIEENGVAALSTMDLQVQDGNLTVRTRRAPPDSAPAPRQPQR